VAYYAHISMRGPVKRGIGSSSRRKRAAGNLEGEAAGRDGAGSGSGRFRVRSTSEPLLARVRGSTGARGVWQAPSPSPLHFTSAEPGGDQADQEGWGRLMSKPDESAYLRRIAASSVRRRRPKIREIVIAFIPYVVLVVVILLAGAAIIMYLGNRPVR
jgi:hypothetical protein